MKLHIESEELGLPAGRLFEVSYSVMYREAYSHAECIDDFECWEILESGEKVTVSWENEEKLARLLLDRASHPLEVQYYD